MTLSIRRIQALALAAAFFAGAVAAQPYKAPRNGFGQPDSPGVWTNASVTQLNGRRSSSR